MKLINKAGPWKYNDDKFTIPLEGTEGAIELQSTRKKVFGLKTLKRGPKEFGYKVKLLKRNTPTSNSQLWLRTQIENEWFTLKNKANGRLLTARDIENTVVAGTFFILNAYRKHLNHQIGPFIRAFMYICFCFSC